jgi:hypothetical protein
MCSTRDSYRFLIKLEFYRHILEKYSNAKFHENPSADSRALPSKQVTHYEANSRFSQFCEGA